MSAGAETAAGPDLGAVSYDLHMIATLATVTASLAEQMSDLTQSGTLQKICDDVINLAMMARERSQASIGRLEGHF